MKVDALCMRLRCELLLLLLLLQSVELVGGGCSLWVPQRGWRLLLLDDLRSPKTDVDASAM